MKRPSPICIGPHLVCLGGQNLPPTCTLCARLGLHTVLMRVEMKLTVVVQGAIPIGVLQIQVVLLLRGSLQHCSDCWIAMWNSGRRRHFCDVIRTSYSMHKCLHVCAWSTFHVCSQATLRNWIDQFFMATDDKTKCFSREDLYYAYLGFQAQKSTVSEQLFGDVIRDMFPNVTEIVSGGTLLIGCVWLRRDFCITRNTMACLPRCLFMDAIFHRVVEFSVWTATGCI